MADPSDIPPGKSPRRELQGPRPAPLKIHKDSHKIKKPPVPPPPQLQLQPQPPMQAAQPPRQPVIIYTVSPKIIHTSPNDFMDLVQRLTGLPRSTDRATVISNPTTSSTSTSTSTSTTNPMYDSHVSYGGRGGGSISPAARFAAMEKAKAPQLLNKNNSGINDNSHHVTGLGLLDHHHHHHQSMDYDHNIAGDHHYLGMETTSSNNKGLFSASTGILSPGPASLPPIHPNFFSPPTDSFFHDLSPVLHNNNNNNNNRLSFIEGSSFMPSPAASSYFISPRNLITSPAAPSIDLLFNNIFSDNNL